MKAVFIGSGSVATHLAIALKNKGVTISQIYSRTASNAEILADKVGASFTNDITEIDQQADIYFYAIKDNFLLKLLEQIELPDALHVHTAGSIPMSIFQPFTTKYGVFYPLQTFSKQKEVDFSQSPICIETCNLEVQQQLVELAHLLTTKICIVSTEQRRDLHLAAVFACNFTNYMYDVASKILEETGIGFDLLLPLITETVDKVRTMKPYDAQTGPAVRFDEKTITRHLKMLKNRPDLKTIYKLLSKNIHKRHSNN